MAAAPVYEKSPENFYELKVLVAVDISEARSNSIITKMNHFREVPLPLPADMEPSSPAPNRQHDLPFGS